MSKLSFCLEFVSLNHFLLKALRKLGKVCFWKISMNEKLSTAEPHTKSNLLMLHKLSSLFILPKKCHKLLDMSLVKLNWRKLWKVKKILANCEELLKDKIPKSPIEFTLTSLSLSESLMCWAMKRTDWIAASTSDVSRLGITICSCSNLNDIMWLVIQILYQYLKKPLTVLMMSHVIESIVGIFEFIWIICEAVSIMISTKIR